MRARDSVHAPLEHLNRNAFVFRNRRQAVNAGQVNDSDFAATLVSYKSGVVFYGDAWKIANLLAKSGKTIEERGLA
jgi:hypothetical protein